MALTLPYPSMSFVPLDVLTAEEMNHIVSNYTYIANQFPISGANIDWTTMNYGSTTEDVVVGVYNGSPVYRHVEEFTTSSTGWLQTNFARPIANFGKLINVSGSVHQTGSGTDNWFSVFRIRPSNATYGTGVAAVTGSAITFDIDTDVNGRKDIIVFIDYTKN
jgi:hypothetical protein